MPFTNWHLVALDEEDVAIKVINLGKIDQVGAMYFQKRRFIKFLLEIFNCIERYIFLARSNKLDIIAHALYKENIGILKLD